MFCSPLDSATAGLDAGDIGEAGGEGWGDSDLVIDDGLFEFINSYVFVVIVESIKYQGSVAMLSKRLTSESRDAHTLQPS